MDYSAYQNANGFSFISKNTLEAALKGKEIVRSFNTVADMQASNLKNGDLAITKGYYSVNDGGGAFYRITDTASQTDYQESVGSLYATLLIENSELNVKQFGAYGDNTHDDTTAIQSAINYANVSNNKTIFIPNGTYLCNIIVYPNTEIKGEIETVLKSVANNSLDVIKSYDFDDMTGTTSAIPVDEGLYNFKLTNLTIDGNLTNSSAGYGIKIFGRNMKFSNINVKNCASGGIYTEFGTHNAPTTRDDSFYSDLLESVFEKIKIFNCTGNGWTYKGPHDSHIKYLICVKCQGWAINADNSSSNGLIIENLNSWWCDNGVVLQTGRLTNCQIDGGSYDGSGSSSTSIGLKLRDDGGGAFISNCSIGTWGIGAELGGTGHIINGLWVRNAINTNIHYTNFSQSILSFRISTNKTGTNIFSIDMSGANNVTGFISASAGNTLFNNRSPYSQGANSYNITSTLEDYIYYQLPTTSINTRGWKPVLPLSNGTLIPNNKIPTATERGGVLRQTLAAFPSGEAATTDQLNTLMAALRTAGVLFHIQ